MIRTRNIIRPIIGVKLYSSSEKSDFYINTLRDGFLGNISFGKYTWRPTDIISLSSSFVLTDSMDYEVVNGGLSGYVPIFNMWADFYAYRVFITNTNRFYFQIKRFTDRGISFLTWYDYIQKGYLSYFNRIAINFDNISENGVWVGYSSYAKVINRSLSLEIGGRYKNIKSLDGIHLYGSGNIYYFLMLSPWTLQGYFEKSYYGYLKHIFLYDEIYGIEDFTSWVINITPPGIFVSDWKSFSHPLFRRAVWRPCPLLCPCLSWTRPRSFR